MAVSQDQNAGAPPAKEAKGKGKKDAPVDPDAELSEEDLELKRRLEELVASVCAADPAAQKAALASICAEIQSATSAMSAVPKPLKFLVLHVDALKAAFERLAPRAPNRAGLADVLSVLASTVAGKEGERLGLRYKLAGGLDDLGQWGHEYLRHISGEVAEEFKVRGGAGAHLCACACACAPLAVCAWVRAALVSMRVRARAAAADPARRAARAPTSRPPCPLALLQVRQEAGEPAADLMHLVEQVGGGGGLWGEGAGRALWVQRARLRVVTNGAGAAQVCGSGPPRCARSPPCAHKAPDPLPHAPCPLLAGLWRTASATHNLPTRLLPTARPCPTNPPQPTQYPPAPADRAVPHDPQRGARGC